MHADRVRKVIFTQHHTFFKEVSIHLSNDVPLGLKLHQGLIENFVRLNIKRLKRVDCKKSKFCRFYNDEGQAEDIAENLFRALMKNSRIPLNARQTELALGISNIERNRWTKSGQLKTSGAAQIKRGNKITLPTYAPYYIETLSRQSDVIDRWRAFVAENG